MELNSKIPEGPIAEKWTNYKFDRKLVNPANRRKYDIIVVGTGLAGGAAAATLGEQGYNVKAFTFHDSPSVAAAAPPARPVPTTMMSYLRRLAGFTSLRSNL